MRTFPMLAIFVLVAACDSLPKTPSATVSAPAMPATPGAPEMPATAGVPAIEAPELGKLLGGITDGASADAAKGPLDAGVNQLQTLLGGVDAKASAEAAANGTNDAGSRAQAMTNDVLAKCGLGGGSAEAIHKLLEVPSVKSAIGPTLERLQGLLPAR